MKVLFFAYLKFSGLSVRVTADDGEKISFSYEVKQGGKSDLLPLIIALHSNGLGEAGPIAQETYRSITVLYTWK